MSESPDTAPAPRRGPAPASLRSRHRPVRSAVLPALVPVALFLSIAWFDFGDGLNIPSLFWAGGVLTGLSVTLLFAYLTLVTYVLDATFDPGVLVEDDAPQGWHTRLAMWAFPNRAAPRTRRGSACGRTCRSRSCRRSSCSPCPRRFRVGGDPPFVVLPRRTRTRRPRRPLFLTRWPVLVGIALGLVVMWLFHRVAERLFEPWVKLVDRYSVLVELVARNDPDKSSGGRGVVRGPSSRLPGVPARRPVRGVVSAAGHGRVHVHRR